MPSSHYFKVKGAIKPVLIVIFLFVLIFIPAGTLCWPEAWIFLFFYFVVVLAAMIWRKKNTPGLLKERMSTKKDAKKWDKKIIIAYSFMLIIILAVPGLDAVRYSWSEIPLIAKVLGFVGYIPAAGLMFWAMKENAYLSDVVRIQEDRGHTVCTTGPYKYIRHPMYAGVILSFLCFPLSLGSLYSFIPAALIIGLFVLRTLLGDKILKEELPGYKEYTQKARFRLLPGVW